jgi:hypothetical protein
MSIKVLGGKVIREGSSPPPLAGSQFQIRGSVFLTLLCLPDRLTWQKPLSRFRRDFCLWGQGPDRHTLEVYLLRLYWYPPPSMGEVQGRVKFKVFIHPHFNPPPIKGEELIKKCAKLFISFVLATSFL